MFWRNKKKLPDEIPVTRNQQTLATLNKRVKELKSSALGYPSMEKHFCDHCGAELIPGKEFCPNCLLRVAVVIPGVPQENKKGGEKKRYPKDTPENRAKRMKEFKIVVVQDKILFSLGAALTLNTKNVVTYQTQQIEDKLNELGLEGWSIKHVENRRKLDRPTDLIFESIVFLERDLPLEP